MTQRCRVLEKPCLNPLGPGLIGGTRPTPDRNALEQEGGTRHSKEQHDSGYSLTLSEWPVQVVENLERQGASDHDQDTGDHPTVSRPFPSAASQVQAQPDCSRKPANGQRDRQRSLSHGLKL